MNVLVFAQDIYQSEIIKSPDLEKHKNIIYTAALLHDMCDKKYMDEIKGIVEMEKFIMGPETDITSADPSQQIPDISIQPLTTDDMQAVKQIILTMSYSKVKVKGFPSLGEYQHAYHIVREADLLAAYDFDRCMVYHMKTRGYDGAFACAEELFKNRVLRHNEDGLFITDYSKTLSKSLHRQALHRIETWRKLM